jgi:hypothetical protein
LLDGFARYCCWEGLAQLCHRVMDVNEHEWS